MPSLCVVTGNMQTLSGGGLPQGTVTFQLMNLAIGTIPQVTGTALLPQTQYKVQTALDGSFTVNLWGNDNIVPSTTFYGVTFRDVSGNELGPILFYILGASVNLNTLAASSGGALAIVNGVFTNPQINGTPTGTGISTYNEKLGSGGGNYTTVSLTLVDVDAVNLANTITIPIGWKLVVTASGMCAQATAAVGLTIGIFDSVANNTVGSTPVITPSNTTSNTAFATQAVIAGDGQSHVIKLRFSTTNASDAALIQNTGAAIPVMIFMLSPSN